MTPPRNGRRAVIGIDVGTLSGRAVVVSVDDGTTLHRLRALHRKADRDR